MTSSAAPTPDAVTTAYLGLGSNMGDSRAILRRAVGAMPDVIAVSPVYETEPVGGVEQGVFQNIVVEVETILGPKELLARCLELEQAEGRTRTIRWGPRTLDIDVLLYGRERLDLPDLMVPHPRMHERNFVMVPLLDLDPTLADSPLLSGYDPALAIGTVQKVGAL